MLCREAVIDALKRLMPRKLYLKSRRNLKYLLTGSSRRRLAKKKFLLADSRAPLLSYASMAPRRRDISWGGRVKLVYLAETFPEQEQECNILYLVRSALPLHLNLWIEKAKKQGIKIVLNQDGVAYSGWFGKGWEIENEPLKKALHSADYIFYQSIFSKKGSEKFLGAPQAENEILYNPVDTAFFTPQERKFNVSVPVLLLGGNQYQQYRFECALRTAAIVKKKLSRIRLLVSGALNWDRRADRVRTQTLRLMRELNLEENVSFTGVYPQTKAPEIYRQADVFLHTKYNDPCPTAVIEAMACGLPVVYSDSGGVRELVGSNAGIGVAIPLTWEEDLIPAPELFADAVLEAFEKRKVLSEAARERVTSMFDVAQWLVRHRTIFEKILA